MTAFDEAGAGGAGDAGRRLVLAESPLVRSDRLLAMFRPEKAGE
jgi:hypothetical protein